MKAVEGFRLYFPEREIQVATSWEVADWRYLGSSKFKHKQETDFASFMGNSAISFPHEMGFCRRLSLEV
jgi:hypothetical protein